MHLLYCDESNMEERDGDFLVYLGLIIDAAAAWDISREIDVVRTRLRVPRDYRLKFNPGPPGFTNAQFIELKSAVMEVAIRHNVAISAYLVLHNIAVDPDLARRNGINTVCYNYDCELHRRNDSGIVLIDRFTDAGNEIEAHLSEKFSVGLVGMPYAGEMPLTRIFGYHYSAIGQSHFASLVDIVTGSFRFAINAHTRAQNQHLATARRLIQTLSPMFLRNGQGEAASELGLTFSPKTVRSAAHRQRYEALKGFLAEAGLPTEQVITGDRRF